MKDQPKYDNIITAIKCNPEKLHFVCDELTDEQINYLIHKIMFEYCGDCIRKCKTIDSQHIP